MLSKKSRFVCIIAANQNISLISQDGYFYLLQRYLQTKFAGCQAQEIFLTLTGKLLELHRLNDAHTKVNSLKDTSQHLICILTALHGSQPEADRASVD